MDRHNGGPAVVEPQRFDVAVSLATGHCSPRDADAGRWLAEHPWTAPALASQLEPFRRRARRLLAQRDRSSYRVALDRAQPRAMLPYDRLFPHDWDLIVANDGHYVWARDQHCPNAACSCRELVVSLYDLNAPDTPSIGQLRVDLQSRNPRSNASSSSAARWFEPLWAQYGTELTRRHNEVRQAVVTYAASREKSRLSSPARNAPCPCGSGRKFKRCCALRDPVPAAPTGAER